jgi:ABC-type branched-subunit amino acid transport system ATPase component
LASINEINTGSSYTGNSALGGSIGVGVTLDPSPIQRFSTFTYYRDRDLWEQKQKDDAVAANQVATIAAYDITSPLTPYSDSLKAQLKEIQDYTRENPDALVYSRNPKKFQELNAKINKFNTFRKSGTASDTIYNARKSAIDLEPDQNKKALMQTELDLDVKDLFAQGLDKAVNQTLRTVPAIKAEDYKIPDTKITSYDVVSSTPNSDIVSGFKFVNLDQLRADSELLASGIGKAAVDENAAWFKALSPERQDLERKKGAVSSSQRQQLSKISGDFNGVLNQYKAANPTVDITQITGNPTGNDTFMDMIKSTNAINKQINELNQLITAGKYKDPTGKVITKTFDIINLSDGLSEAEVIMVHALQKSGTSIWSLDKKIQQSDNAIQGAQLAETVRHNKATENINAGELKQKQDEWKLKMTGSDPVKNGALERAKRIYADLQKLSNKAGVITPDKVRQLTTEQLKYLGIEQVETSDAGVPRSIFKPLDLAAGEDKTTYAIQLQDGNIRVMKNAKKLDSGDYTGLWDNSKSTNLFNVGTNILNEELQKAGTKELNSYMPIDLGGAGGTISNTPGATSVTTTTKTVAFDKSKLSPIVKNGVTYYVDATTRKVFDEKGNELQ